MTPWSADSGNAIELGVASSPVLVAVPVTGTIRLLPVLVVNVRLPSVAPGADVTATCSWSPLWRVTGNVTGCAVALPFLVSVTWPTVNCAVSIP